VSDVADGAERGDELSGGDDPRVVEVTSELWPDRLEGPFLLTLVWQEVDGRAEVVGMELNSVRSEALKRSRFAESLSDTGTPLTTTMLRNLKLSEIAADTRTSLEFLHREVLRQPTKAAAYDLGSSMRPATVKRLREVADAYRRAWARGQHPTKAVAKRLNVTDAAAANLVSRARSIGLLPPTSPGVPLATPKNEPIRPRDLE
jgi:hypothetical protein